MDKKPAALGVPVKPFSAAGLRRLREGMGRRGLDKEGVERLLATIEERDRTIEVMKRTGCTKCGLYPNEDSEL